METSPKLILAYDANYQTGPYHVLRKSRPYVEYIQNDEGGFYLCGNNGSLEYYKRLFIGKRDATLKREYRRLVTAGIVSCPSDAGSYRDAEEIFEAILMWLKRALILGGEGEYTAIAAYSMMTWFAFRYDTVPYLRFLGDYGNGKSTALRALSELCYRAVNISGVVSPAPIYRLIKEIQGTLVIDEADMQGSPWYKQVIHILNHGYSRGVAVVRIGRRYEPETFEPFGPKVIATREEFDDRALESRCLTIKMPHRKITEPVNFSDEKISNAAAVIRNKLLIMRMEYADCGRDTSVFRREAFKTPEHWEPRVRQVVQPLFDLTPIDYRKEMEIYMESMNMRYCETLHNTTEAQVMRILRKANSYGISKLTLGAIYEELSYECRKNNSMKKISKIMETLGARKRHGREGCFYSWEDDILS
ncbi:hypothetical protein K9N50_10465 [bacterium]|nr:hypothetical protein [bacterium]